MIYSLNGKIVSIDQTSVVIECGGVGYKCTATYKTLASLPSVGENAFIYTYMQVREDAVDLFGFASAEEMQCFKTLISVNGVGAKVGIAILSEFTFDYVYAFIAGGDYKSFTAAAGVGPKLAQRIVLELKDKVGSLTSSEIFETPNLGNATYNSNTKEAVAALEALGYSKTEAASAVGKLDMSLTTEELIKQALKTLARGI